MILSVFKKLFNKIFKEETKDILRKKFEGVFIYLDKRILYREYLKACKYILHEKIYRYLPADYGYRDNDFVKKIKEEYLYSKFQRAVSDGQLHIQDKEMDKYLDYVKNNGFDVYCGSLDGIQIYSEEDVHYDADNCLFYGIYEGKKLYFSEKYHTAEDVLAYMNEIAAEQSEHSPHKYLTEEFDVDKEDIVFDIGCAEGNFSLSVVDRVKELYLFEAEETWMKPLKLTFAPYMDKVHIIQKYAAKDSSAHAVSVNDFCRENNIREIGFVKMDVEGAEQDVLLGASEMIRQNKIKRMAVCTYHKINDEEVLGALLPNYQKVMSEGYMLHTVQSFDLWNMKLPYFTRGLMRATIQETQEVSEYEKN